MIPLETSASECAGEGFLFWVDWKGWLVLTASHGADREHGEHGAVRNGVSLL